jgi:hypothetical protein
VVTNPSGEYTAYSFPTGRIQISVAQAASTPAHRAETSTTSTSPPTVDWPDASRPADFENPDYDNPIFGSLNLPRPLDFPLSLIHTRVYTGPVSLLGRGGRVRFN